MKKPMTLIGLTLASTMLMGISMPSCPGQEAMQKQIEELQTSQADLNKKVQALAADLTAAQTDLNQMKEVFPQMGNAIQSQQTTLEALDKTVQELKSKDKSKAKKATKPAKKQVE